MIDKKGNHKPSLHLRHPGDWDDLNVNQNEQVLISRLIELSHQDRSLRSYSHAALNLLARYPLLTEISTAVWECNLSGIHVIESCRTSFDIEKELRSVSVNADDWQVLKIPQVLHPYSANVLKKRADICLGKKQQTFICLSLWFPEAIDSNILSLRVFLKDFLGVFHLSLINIMSEKREKLLTTILEKAGDAIEITDEEAVIQYVNPAFEKITQYSAAEAVNKTVASLLRSPEEDKALFEHIKVQLESGVIWQGNIKSKKKDRTDWIAKTTIVPVLNENGVVAQHIAIKHDITEQVNQLNQLKISEERYRNLMNAAADAIFIHDLSGKMLEVNDAACLSLNYSREEMRHAYVWDIEVGASQDALNQMWQELQTGPITLEGRHRRKDGTTFPVDVRLGIFNATGEKLVLAIVRDITAKKRSESIIKKLTRALEQSPVLVMITDKSGTIEYVNAKVIEQTGYCAEEIIGQNTRMLQSGKTPREIYQAMWEQLERGEEWRGELLNKNKKGEFFWVSAIISSLRNEEDQTTHYLAVMEDVSQKKSYEEMLKYQATYDNLTNLPNRVFGVNKLERAISKASADKKMLAVLFLDLDEFKQINDSMGHSVGDLLLKALSERYITTIRQTDTIARLGGDEFMLILEDLTDVSDAERIAQKCQEVCLKPFKIESQELLVSSSIGIALFPQHGRDAKTLMHNADTAMYQSKMKGKNT